MSLPLLREKLLSLCGIQIACHFGQKIPQYSIHGASSGYCVPSLTSAVESSSSVDVQLEHTTLSWQSIYAFWNLISHLNIVV